MLLKAQLHIHSQSDPADVLLNSEKEIIDHAKKLNYDILAFTCHNKNIFTEELQKYAQERDILLIPGIELRVGLKHVVVLNPKYKEIEEIKTFYDLQKYREKDKEAFFLAPHPFFYDPSCLKKALIKYIDLFDAVEYCFWHTKKFNPNRRGKVVAEFYNLPLIGTSDNHMIDYFDSTFTLIDTDKKDIKSVFKAIKNFKYETISKNLKPKELLKIRFQMLYNNASKILPVKPIYR